MAWDGMGGVRSCARGARRARAHTPPRRPPPRSRRHRRPRDEGRRAGAPLRARRRLALPAPHQRLRLAAPRCRMALGVGRPRGARPRHRASWCTRAPRRARASSRQLALKLPELAHIPPALGRRTGACQDVVVQGDDVDLDALPILTCWPRDGGPFITLPQVITRDPGDRCAQRRLLPDAEARPAHHRDALADPQDGRAALPPREGARPAAPRRRRRARRRSRR